MSAGVADPHCHTTASDGMVTARDLVTAAAELKLSVIAITDHDTMAAVGEALEWGAKLGVGVIPGQEITTAWPAQTHVVGWFLDKPVRSGMSLADTVAAIHARNGLAVIPHPFMPTYFGSCQPGMLRRLLETTSIDAIEVMHTAPTTRGRQALLEEFCRANAVRVGAIVGSSDSHFGRVDLRRRLTVFEGSTADDFRRAVAARTTRPEPGNNRKHIPLAMLARQQGRSLVELPLRRLFGRLG